MILVHGAAMFDITVRCLCEPLQEEAFIVLALQNEIAVGPGEIQWFVAEGKFLVQDLDKLFFEFVQVCIVVVFLVTKDLPDAVAPEDVWLA